MHRLRLRKPSPAMAVAIVALIFALGGTAVAKFGPFKGDKIIKKKSLSGSRLKNHTITGNQVNLSQLGKVPNATNADTAGNANALGGVAPSGYAGSAQPAFISPTLNAGYSNFGGGTTAGYMKDTLGFVHLKGVLNCPMAGGTAFTLPVGYRPSADTLLVGADGQNAISVFVKPNGDVRTANRMFDCSLDGITFPPAGTAGTAPVSHSPQTGRNAANR